jgi:hypothetical protein
MLCLADRSFFGFEVTAILDYEQAPAAELAALYPERWEIERKPLARNRHILNYVF